MTKEIKVAGTLPTTEQVSLDAVPRLKIKKTPRLRKTIAVGVLSVATALAAASCDIPVIGQSPGSSSTPTPAETATPTPSEATGSPIPKITIAPTETPSVTPEPTVPYGSENPSTPEPAAKLDIDLKSWLDGTYKMPKILPYQGDYDPINITAGVPAVADGIAQNAGFVYQGVALGYEIIDNHLIVYWGQKDKKNTPYYFASNYGDIANPQYMAFTASGLSKVLDQGKLAIYDYPTIIYFLNSHAIGKANVFIPYTNQLTPESSDPNINKIEKEVNAQVNFSRDFCYFSAYAGWTGSYKKSPYYQKVKNIINQQVTATNFNPTEIPAIDMIETR